ncbi:sacsin N-terminal ATP-binding-like domain-containing protein [Flavobacterium sp. NPDC079362]|uniref:sacsin N-terminal ATP-binding-like domain-containing protein n=1 Tax=Flavobacterium sp. NPDC079362 TaxID=3390566 RepID=UPI003D05BC8F
MHKEIIEGLYTRRSQYLDPDQGTMMARMLNIVSKDIYSESQRFVFELIQNADDSSFESGNEVHFDFLDNALIVSHNGRSFSEKDINSLTNSGASTKREDANQTGYKGIGFKSVFGKSNRVSIFSGGFQFRFDKLFHDKELPWQIIPIWTELNDFSSVIQNSLQKTDFNVSTVLEMKNALSLEAELKEVLSDGQILLFLRKVSKISISRNGEFQYFIEKKVLSNKNAFKSVVLLKNEHLISQWIIKTFEDIPVSEATKTALNNDEETPEKLKEIEITEISFAAKVEDDNIKILSKEERLIFTYLPTKVNDMNFPFIVNGNFITNASRESLHKDSAWNKWLFELVAEKTFEWFELLALSEYSYQVLRLLPGKFPETYDRLKSSFNTGYEKNSKLRAFIVSEDNLPKKAGQVLYDKTGLSHQSFINIDSITDYLHKEKNITFEKSSFVNARIQHPEKLKGLGVYTFELDNFESFFTSESFTTRHEVEQNFQLIEFLMYRSDNDSKGEWFQMMKTLPFIYDEDKKLKNPVTGICFPTGSFSASTDLGDIPIIHSEVFYKIEQNDKVYEWLKRLGVKEPSDSSFITNVIVPNLNNSAFITNDNYLDLTIYLHKMYKNNLLDAEMIESLREFKIRIKGEEIIFKQAQNCYLSNVYYPQLPLEGVIGDLNFISEEYLKTKYSAAEWGVFFKVIRVKNKIDIETINGNNTLATVKQITHPEWVDECENLARNGGGYGFGSHNVIGLIKIPSFLNLIAENLDYSKIFWKYMLSNGSGHEELSSPAIFRYGTGNGHNMFSKSVPNYFRWYVSRSKCIPTTSKGLEYSNKVYINIREIKQIAGDYFPVFDCDERPTDGWNEIFNFKNKLDISDYLTILKLISEESKDDTISKNSINRIGLIYNKLSELLPDFAEDTLQLIRKWGSQNQLLAIGNSFEPVTELKWITIDGFSQESSSLKLINIPENCKREKLGSLMSLFGVQIITKFVPELKNGEIDTSFKKRFEDVLPFFSAYLQKRCVDDTIDQFERMFSIIDRTNFYSAQEINLSFMHMEDLIKGPVVTVFKEEKNFYYRGSWRSERILLNFIKEICETLKVFEDTEILRFLLLENDDKEIYEWLKEMNIEDSEIKNRRTFTVKQVLDNSDIIVPAYSSEIMEKEISVNVEEENDDSDNFQYETPFKPFAEFGNFDMSKITTSTRSFNTQDSVTRENYIAIDDKQFRTDVGFFCEGLVNKLLNQEENNYTEIKWENENEESRKPYDFSIIENGVKKYIDVKGTPSSDKNVVFLSLNEWKFMLEHGSNYYIYRVFDANKENPRIEIINNPADLLREGKILPTETSLII